jgi:DNA-binding SARP family transcriptional activator
VGAHNRPDAEPLRLHLLGPFRVAVGERSIADAVWRLRKAAAVVKLLALAPGGRLHREQTLDLLWPDDQPAAASHSLNQALYVARRALAAESPTSPFLRSQGAFLILAPSGRLWTDVNAFTAAAAAARRSRDPAAHHAALALYTGDLLPDDPYEDWASTRRDELRQTRLALLLAVADLHKARGEHADAVAALEQVVASEPAHEEAHVALMRLHAGVGWRTQAARQYRRLEEALRRDLDAEPDPAS